MDEKTARRQAEREDAEERAEYERAYEEYDGVPIPHEPPPMDEDPGEQEYVRSTREWARDLTWAYRFGAGVPRAL